MSDKIERKMAVKNKQGLHVRPAALFVQIANKFDCEVTVRKGKEKVSGKSITGIMMLAIEKGSEIIITAEGPEAQKAMDELEILISGEKDA